MAELKPLGRQIAQPNAPDISGAVQAAGMLGKSVGAVSNVVGDYVKAASEMESAVLYTDISHSLNKQLIEFGSPDSIAQGNAAQRYVQFSNSIIDDAVLKAPRGQGQELKTRLKGVLNTNELKLLAATQDYNFNQSKATIDIAIDAATKNFKESSISGNRYSIQQGKEEVESIYNNAIALGIYTKKNKYDALKALKETYNHERWYKRGENDALAGPGVPEKSMAELVREFPEEGTNEERIAALDAYTKGQSVTLTRQQALRAIEAGNVSLEILKGDITVPAQIHGRDLTAAQGIKAEIELWKQQHKQNKNNEKITQFLSNVQQGNGTQNYPSSPEIKEQGHEIYKELYLDQKRQKTGDPKAQLTIEDEANILTQMNVSIPSIDAQISYALEHANLDNEMPVIEWALGMTRTVGKETPNAIKLDAKNRAIANLANESLQYGRSNARSAIEGARATVDVDEPVLAGRRARQYRNGWDDEMRRAFKEMTNGADPNTNPVAWGAFKSIYSTQAMLSDSQSTAREGARQVMTPAFGESQYFPEKSYGYLPPEKIVPFGDRGNWLESQINMKLIDIAMANHSAPLEQVSNLSKIELGGDPRQARQLEAAIKKKDWDQEHLYNYRFGPTQHYQSGNSIQVPVTYRIAGHDRQVYLEAQNSARLNEGGKLTYAVYTLNPNTGQKEPVMDPRSRTGFASVTIDSLEEFLPGVYDKINNELFDDASKELLTTEYKKLNKIPIVRAYGFGDYIRENYEKVRGQLEKNEKAYTDSEKIIQTKNYTVTKSDVLKQLNKENK